MAAPRRTFEESLEAERGTDVPDADLTTSGVIRRRFFRGEALVPSEVADEMGVTHGLSGQVISVLREIGFEMEMTEVRKAANGRTPVYSYRLVDPDRPFDQALIDAYKERRDERDQAAAERRAEKLAAQSAARAARTTQAAKNATQGTLVEVDGPRAVVEPKAHRRSETLEGPPVPKFGSDLRVYLLLEEDDGTVVMGLANGSAKWLTRVTGFTKVTEE